MTTKRENNLNSSIFENKSSLEQLIQTNFKKMKNTFKRTFLMSAIAMLLLVGCSENDVEDLSEQATSIAEAESIVERSLAYQLIELSDEQRKFHQTIKFSAKSIGKVKNHLNTISYTAKVDGETLSKIKVIDEFEGQQPDLTNEEVAKLYQKEDAKIHIEHLENNFGDIRAVFEVRENNVLSSSRSAYGTVLDHKFPTGHLYAWVEWMENGNSNNGFDCEWYRKYGWLSPWNYSYRQSIYSGNTLSSYDYGWGGKKGSRLKVIVKGNYYNFNYGSN